MPSLTDLVSFVGTHPDIIPCSLSLASLANSSAIDMVVDSDDHYWLLYLLVYVAAVSSEVDICPPLNIHTISYYFQQLFSFILCNNNNNC
jgi:hypothetical protein